MLLTTVMRSSSIISTCSGVSPLHIWERSFCLAFTCWKSLGSPYFRLQLPLHVLAEAPSSIVVLVELLVYGCGGGEKGGMGFGLFP
uniref:Uncharacterized protein n=1 Tax=Manihot esculenta TaxID=3983 RepID=A0A2C9V2L3_MANES